MSTTHADVQAFRRSGSWRNLATLARELVDDAAHRAGLALSALWYLGRNEVTPQTIRQIRSKLPSTEFAALTAAKASMPWWMVDVFHTTSNRRLMTNWKHQLQRLTAVAAGPAA